MSTSYDYSISGDFPNQQVNPSVLYAEINAESAITVPLVEINVDGDVCSIVFEGPLSPAEKTALDNVVSNHSGEATTSDVQYAYSENEQGTTGSTWLEKLELQSDPVGGGEYLVTWYCEIKLLSGTPSTGAFAQLTLNGTERGADVNDLNQWKAFSGSAITPFDAGSEPVLAINWRRLGGSDEALIRRARLSISPVEKGNGE